MASYLITGGTGLIGSALIKQLLQGPNAITVLTRDKNKLRRLLPVKVKGITQLIEIPPEQEIDYVINLAGEPIADKRWSNIQKQKLWGSRVELTQRLVDWLTTRINQPKALISGSAVGWYGDCGERVLTEQNEACVEYTHQLCQAWEQAACKATKLGIRVCIIRTGLVISPQGGFLAKLNLSFRCGLGARLGGGEQYMSWIHLQDMVQALMFLVSQDSTEMRLPCGYFNLTSPNPVTNREFTQAFAKQLSRPSFLVVPAMVLTTLLGEMAQLLLGGQRVIPQRLLDSGFDFQFTTIEQALNDVLH